MYWWWPRWGYLIRNSIMNNNMSNNMSNTYKNWHYEIDADNILWLAFDRECKSVNSLSQEAITELHKIINTISNGKIQIDNLTKQIAGVIIYSAKKTGFIAGADVTEFTTVTSPQEAKVLLDNGQNTMKALASLKVPTVAMIDGFCLGGGLELALACDYRVATDNLSTKLGLPEVMLGIIPAWGGTVRLTKLIGGMNALPLMLQGRMIGSKEAARIGMIDAAVPIRQLKRAAVYCILHKTTSKHQHDKLGFIANLSNQKPFRSVIAYFAKKQLTSKVSKEHYPAPYAILENFEKFGVDDLTRSFKAEVDADLSLVEHDTAKNLIRVFFLQEKLKEFAKKDESITKAKHVHVIGAGTMGGDIAAWCAFRGLKVTLQDQSYEAIAPALGRAFALFKSKVKKDDLANLMLDKITPDINGEGVKHADIIIEAVFEDLEVKQKIFQKLEQQAKPDAILATNTSSILLDEINQVMQDKSRLVGIHFFNPVAKMMLIEVVSGEKTSSDVANRACAFVNQISKLPLPVASYPGFLVNRVLSAYMHETFILLTEGVSPELIDKTMKDFGMAMGPVEMADIVGLDICLSVAKNISKHYGEGIPEILQQKVNQKHLGKKTNKGFYNYKNGKIVRSKVEGSSQNNAEQQNIEDRLVMRILNICIECLDQKVVADPELVDASLIFGAGFAPFRGGPMNYLLTLGEDKFKSKLANLERQYGKRFALNVQSNEERGNYAAVS